MPRFSSEGSALTGIGGLTGNVAVDGAVPAALATAAAGGWAWRTDAIIIGNADAGSGEQLYQVDLGTPGTLVLIENDLASDVGAGNDVWAAFKAATTNGGVRTSVSGLGPFPSASLGDVSHEGDIAIITDYQAGRGLQVYNSNGARLLSLDVVLTSPAVRVRGGIIAYADEAGWHLRNIATGAFIAFAPRTDVVPGLIVPVVLASGAVWVLEHATDQDANDTITLRKAASGTAYTLASGNNLLYPDAIEVSAGVIRAGWSLDQGDTTAGLRTSDVTVASGAVLNGVVSGGTIVRTAGTALTGTAVTVGAIVGGSVGLSVASILQQPVVDPKTQRFTRPWAAWVEKVSQITGGPVDLSRASGILQQQNGGTGNTGGTSGVSLSALQIGTNQRLVGRDSATVADAAALTLSQVLDWLSSTQGAILFRGASGWVALAPGTAGQLLTTGGAAANPAWADPAQVGEWSVLTNGDPSAPAVMFDSNGDVVMTFKAA